MLRSFDLPEPPVPPITANSGMSRASEFRLVFYRISLKNGLVKAKAIASITRLP